MAHPKYDFPLTKEDFTMGEDAKDYENVSNEWIYYNALI